MKENFSEYLERFGKVGRIAPTLLIHRKLVRDCVIPDGIQELCAINVSECFQHTKPEETLILHSKKLMFAAVLRAIFLNKLKTKSMVLKCVKPVQCPELSIKGSTENCREISLCNNVQVHF